MTTRWCPKQLAGRSRSVDPALPIIEPRQVRPLTSGRYYWDQCPIVDGHGSIVRYRESSLWIALSAPAMGAAEVRHERARLRLLMRQKRQWIDCGDLMPDNVTHGSREWAGTAVLRENGELTIYYTATGSAGEKVPTYRQRIFEAAAVLTERDGHPALSGWEDKREPIVADGSTYLVADQDVGEPGAVVGFRDPFYFAGPESEYEYLLFAASSANATTGKKGAIGIAVRRGSGARWTLGPPLIAGDGVTNEMERPHIVQHGGHYYLFWCSHGWTFAGEVDAPTGLYGMVADSVSGPYKPLNGTGLVVTNPESQPYQAYSWFVASDLSVSSFVDMLDGKTLVGEDAPKHPVGTFEGTVAPEFRLVLDGTSARVANSTGETVYEHCGSG